MIVYYKYQHLNNIQKIVHKSFIKTMIYSLKYKRRRIKKITHASYAHSYATS